MPYPALFTLLSRSDGLARDDESLYKWHDLLPSSRNRTLADSVPVYLRTRTRFCVSGAARCDSNLDLVISFGSKQLNLTDRCSIEAATAKATDN